MKENGIKEKTLILFVLALSSLALFGPAIAQSAQYHGFADERSLLGLERAADVLSNLPFAFGGLLGLSVLARQPGRVSRSAIVFFVGLLLTCAGSVWYHLRPDNSTLIVDRLAMVLPFAGILGLALEQRVSQRAGNMMLILVLLAGPLSLWVWTQSGSILGWAVLQAGGMLLLCALSFVKPLQPKGAVSLVAIVLIYGLAKVCEGLDAQIFEMTGHFISGHSLKHLVASAAALPVIAALLQRSGALRS